MNTGQFVGDLGLVVIMGLSIMLPSFAAIVGFLQLFDRDVKIGVLGKSLRILLCVIMVAIWSYGLTHDGDLLCDANGVHFIQSK